MTITSTIAGTTIASTTAGTTMAAIRLSSDTATGKVTFDDQPAADLQDSQWGFDGISAGDHTLKFVGPVGNAEIGLTSSSGTLSVLTAPITATGVLALVVSSMGEHAHIYSSDPTVKVSLDGQAQVDISPEGIDLPSVAAGAHEFTVTRGAEEYKLAIETTSGPTLSAFIESGQNVGTLLIVTGQDKARVFLNGKPLDQQTQGGQLRIANLEPKEYTVRVAKSGYQDIAEQKIRIRKGQQGRLVFSLQPALRMATLNIQGGTPGAGVFIDQASIGTVQPDGALSLSSIAPGDHMIEIRKDRFKPKQLKRHFVVGTPVTLASSDMTLEAAPAELKITYSPAEAQISLNKSGEPPIKLTSGSALSLAGGSYNLAAHMPDGFVQTAPLELVGGQSRSIDLSLVPNGMSRWDDAAAWRQENGAFVRKGGDYVLYGVQPTSGTFVFSAMLTKGRRLQWVVNYIDPNNYDLFQIDDNNFYRTNVRNGQKQSDSKTPHKSGKKSLRTLQIHVSPNEITHMIKEGESWTVLDRFTQAGANLSSGKFGFYLPGGDQISLATFSHYADLSLH